MDASQFRHEVFGRDKKVQTTACRALAVLGRARADAPALRVHLHGLALRLQVPVLRERLQAPALRVPRQRLQGELLGVWRTAVHVGCLGRVLLGVWDVLSAF